MMEIDRMSYIFGSFARRRQSQEVALNKRISLEKTTICHDRSNSTPNTNSSLKKSTVSPRAKSICIPDDSKFKCPMCRRIFQNPKVLPCLHTFCLQCLQELEANQCPRWGDEDESDGSGNTSESRKGSGSGGSGYVSDKNNTLNRSCSPTNVKWISCPTCGARAEVPVGGVSFFPSNYPLQHRMALATLNAQNTPLLCDICSSEVTARSRCMECAINFCEHCEELHLRQKSSANHEVLSLKEARKKGITRVRRQIMCETHKEVELSLFCMVCCQVICRECISVSHKGHPFEPVSKSVKSHLSNLRLAAEKAKSVAEQSAIAANRLHITSKKIDYECDKIQGEVEKFMKNYIKALQEHQRNLIEQISQTRIGKLEEISRCKTHFHRRVRQARDLTFFLEELLNEGSDVEIMSFVKPIMRRMEECCEKEHNGEISSNLQFLPDESVKYAGGSCTLYGVITTQMVSPSHCILNTEGLKNLRVGKKTEISLELRDQNNLPLQRGGEEIFAEIRYRDAGVSRFLHVEVEDHKDGFYSISFVPDVAGKLILNVKIKGESIKDNPFPVVVRSLKLHNGTFHCCSFCSSGGSKEASCGCGGRMPGGYRGCGHGHEGHPGRRHWSCCGNVLEHSECSRSNPQSHYHITL